MLCYDSSPATSMPVFEAKLLASLTDTCITQQWFSESHVGNQHRHLQLLASASASTALPATVCCLESWEAATESLDHQALIPYDPLLVGVIRDVPDGVVQQGSGALYTSTGACTSRSHIQNSIHSLSSQGCILGWQAACTGRPSHTLRSRSGIQYPSLHLHCIKRLYRAHLQQRCAAV